MTSTTSTSTTTTPQQYSMERVLFNVHCKICMFALRRTSSRARSLAERTLLILAVCGFGVLLLSHLSFVFRSNSSTSSNSSSSGSHFDFSSSSQPPIINSRTVSTSTTATASSWRTSTPLTCLNQIPGFTKHADITHFMLIEEETSNDDHNNNERSKSSSSWAWTVWPNKKSSRLQDEKNQTIIITEAATTKVCTTEDDQRRTLNDLDTTDAYYIYFSYSRVKGYLFLPSPKQHNISVQYVFVSKTDVHCFGEPFLQHIIFHFLGPDTVMINWLLALDEDVTTSIMHNTKDTTSSSSSSSSSTGLVIDQAGYVYNPRTDLLIDLHPSSSSSSSSPTIHTGNSGRSKSSSNSSSSSRFRLLFGTSFWMRIVMETLDKKLALVLKTSFLFFITTTLVSFTLRETQERMVDFTHQLHYNVRNRRPIFRLVMTHFIDNLVFVPIMVGMIFFLIEFYQGDKVLAFMVLSIVWICEVFCLVSLRTLQGIHFFPRVFFLLFSMFHFYLFSFPHGFSYTALACTVCFMVHSMLFFWHRYELPAVARGLVTIENPRIGYRRPSAPLPPPHHGDPLPGEPPIVVVGSHQQQLSTPPAPPRPVHPLTQLHQQQQQQQQQQQMLQGGQLVYADPPLTQQPASGRAVARRNSLPAAFTSTTGTASSTTNHGTINTNGSDGMATPPTPFLYPVLRRTFSQTSSTANMSAVSGSGRISRQPSMTGLFRSGVDDDDDADGDHNGDFIFFMGGEVVMHRGQVLAAPSTAPYSAQLNQQQRQQNQYYLDTSPPQRQQQQQQQQQPHPPTVGLFIDNSSHGGSTQSGAHQQEQQRGSTSDEGMGDPYHQLVSVGVGPPTSLDGDDQGNTNGSLLDPSNNGHCRIEQQKQRQHRSHSVICSTASSTSSTPPSPPSVVVLVNQSGGDDEDSNSSDNSNNGGNNNDNLIDPPETSALQAILNISTPRRDNHGLSIRHRGRQENPEQDCRGVRGRRSLPGFPSLDDN